MESNTHTVLINRPWLIDMRTDIDEATRLNAATVHHVETRIIFRDAAGNIVGDFSGSDVFGYGQE